MGNSIKTFIQKRKKIQKMEEKNTIKNNKI